MSVFVSYARRDFQAVAKLRDDLKQITADQIWIDDFELAGGETWWPSIVEHIRECSVFVFALSNKSVRSIHCLTELRFAVDLGKHVVPVQIANTTAKYPPEVDARHIVEYRTSNPSAGIRLTRAIDHAFRQRLALPFDVPSPPLPQPRSRPRHRRRGARRAIAIGAALALTVAVTVIVQAENSDISPKMSRADPTAILDDRPLPGPANDLQQFFSVTTALIDGSEKILAGSSDGSITEWGIDALDKQLVFPLKSGYVHSVAAVSAGGGGDSDVVTLAATENGGVQAINMVDNRISDLNEPVQKSTSPNPPRPATLSVAALDVPGGSLVATGGVDGQVRVWSLGTESRPAMLTRTFTVGDTVSTVAFIDHDAPSVIAAGHDRKVHVWNLVNGEEKTLEGDGQNGHHGFVLSVISADTLNGTKIISAADDGTICIWNADTGKLDRTIPRDETPGNVRSITVASVGGASYLVAGGDDWTIRAWRLESGAKCAAPVGRHAGPVYSLAFVFLDLYPVLISASGDHTVHTWDLTKRLAGC